jgi:hypothetical protein
MACGMNFLKWLDGLGAFPRGARILDIGESNLMAATSDEIGDFVATHADDYDREHVNKMAPEFAYRSNLMGHATIQTLFLSELIDLTNLHYVSFDVVSARKAQLFDLNVHDLAADKQGTFDVVLNFGTTEHLMNQFNAYKVMHEAAREGGLIFHQVPATGFINHGYFSYNALMFQDLAQANGYDIVDLWFYGPCGTGNLLVNGETHPGVIDPTKPMNNVEGFRDAPVPNSLINVLFRKTKAGEFRVGLEVTTAAAVLKENIFNSEYIREGQRAVPEPEPEPPAEAPAPPPPATPPILGPEPRPGVGKLLKWVGGKIGFGSRRAG